MVRSNIMARFDYPNRVYPIEPLKKYPIRVGLGFLTYVIKENDPIENWEVMF